MSKFRELNTLLGAAVETGEVRIAGSNAGYPRLSHVLITDR